ncbi:Uncharacterised protein [Mycobacteroides abscessus subsp. abscessus]|nr:Uncharacterised protein [Mycobacteroides abscessus subsp. abscessus]
MPARWAMSASGDFNAEPSLWISSLICGPVSAVARSSEASPAASEFCCAGSAPTSSSESCAKAVSVSVRLFGVSVRVMHAPLSQGSVVAPEARTASSRSATTVSETVVAEASA